MNPSVVVTAEQKNNLIKSCQKLGFTLIEENKNLVIYASVDYIARFEKTTGGYIYTLKNKGLINKLNI